MLLAHEAEGLLAQIEEVAHAAGFGGDTDFGRMTNGLREVHKVPRRALLEPRGAAFESDSRDGNRRGRATSSGAPRSTSW